MAKIIPVPAFRDNYIWLIIENSNKKCIIVDPGDAAPVIATLTNEGLTPVAIFVTHHHFDHCAGVAELLERYRVPVYGSSKENSEAITNPVHGGENLKFPQFDLIFEVIEIPGHTLDHLAFYAPGMLFCGDTLFTAGCGRIFEGTAEQLYDSLQIIAHLPDNTNIYCGHEYTLKNLLFAAIVDPHNPDIQSRLEETRLLVQQGWPTVPATLAIEKATNPFLRIHEQAITNSLETKAGRRLDNPQERFALLREWKNNFI